MKNKDFLDILLKNFNERYGTSYTVTYNEKDCEISIQHTEPFFTVMTIKHNNGDFNKLVDVCTTDFLGYLAFAETYKSSEIYYYAPKDLSKHRK